MSETNSQDETSVSSEDGKQNEPLQTISTNIPEVTEIVDFTNQITTINSRVNNLESNMNNKFDVVNNRFDAIKCVFHQSTECESGG